MRQEESNPNLQYRNVPLSERFKTDLKYFPEEHHKSAIRLLEKKFSQFAFITHMEYACINDVPTIRVISEDLILTAEWLPGHSTPTHRSVARCLSCGREAAYNNVCGYHAKILSEKGSYSICMAVGCTNVTDDSDTSTCSEHYIKDLPLEDQKYFLQEPVHQYVTEGR